MAAIEIYLYDDDGADVAFACKEVAGDTYDDLMLLLDEAAIDTEGQLFDRLVDAVDGEGPLDESDQHELSDGCCASSGALRECCDCLDDDFDSSDLVVMDLVEYLNQFELVFREAGHRVVDLANTVVFSFAKGFRDTFHSDHHFTD